jgi:hypothetical protein
MSPSRPRAGTQKVGTEARSVGRDRRHRLLREDWPLAPVCMAGVTHLLGGPLDQRQKAPLRDEQVERARYRRC